MSLELDHSTVDPQAMLKGRLRIAMSEVEGTVRVVNNSLNKAYITRSRILGSTTLTDTWTVFLSDVLDSNIQHASIYEASLVGVNFTGSNMGKVMSLQYLHWWHDVP